MNFSKVLDIMSSIENYALKKMVVVMKEKLLMKSKVTFQIENCVAGG